MHTYIKDIAHMHTQQDPSGCYRVCIGAKFSSAKGDWIVPGRGDWKCLHTLWSNPHAITVFLGLH